MTIDHTGREQIKARESRFRRRFHLALSGMVVAILISVFLAATYGRFDLSAAEVLRAIMAGLGLRSESATDSTSTVVVFHIRLSRIFLSSLVGLALAVAGVAFQGILRNPLADPFTLGVSTGAAFGASMAIFFGLGAEATLGIGLLPLASLAGAVTALVTVIALARVDGQLRRDSMVLAGIVVATFLAALISLLKSLDEESVSSIVFWVMGSFQGRGWSHVGFALPYTLVGLILVGAHAHELDLLTLGDTQARQLGVDVNRVRMRILLGASLLTAAAVSVSGVIGFVGLIVPHLVRITIGPEHRRLLVLSGLLGMILLTWSDVVARTALPAGEELPVGVVTALLGGPFFCLLLKSKKELRSLD
ncbi:MAG: iron ABC transporter permease [Deltaproteobacteria bacterium]|nr:iron ABC transporter permease [Deltaproteobacteria bacterium]